jgi:hypothetical protein
MQPSSQLRGSERAVKHNYGLARAAGQRGFPDADPTDPKVVHPRHTFPFLNILNTG